MVISPERNTAIFFRTSLVLNERKNRFLHVVPSYKSNPLSVEYEIHGTDQTRIENSIKCNVSNKPIISFFCTMGETYFIKIIATYTNSIQEFFLFYKMEDDFEETTDENEETEYKDSDNEKEDTENNTQTVEEYEENKITRYMFSQAINSGLDLGIDEELDVNTI